MSLDVDPTHFHHQPHPLHTPYTNTTPALSNTDSGDHISMQDCPAYQPIEDTPTLGEYTYVHLSVGTVEPHLVATPEK